MTKADFSKNCLISIVVILLYFLIQFFVPNLVSESWNSWVGSANAKIGILIYDIISYILLVAILITIYYKSLKEEWQIFIKNKKKNLMDILKYTIIIFLGVIICNAILRYIFHLGVIENETHLLNLFEKSPIGILIMVTLYYPLIEVIVFQKSVRQVVKNPVLFILVSSIFFGYFNIVSSGLSFETVICSIPYIFINAISAYSYHKSNNVVVPVGTKLLYNLLVTIISFV